MIVCYLKRLHRFAIRPKTSGRVRNSGVLSGTCSNVRDFRNLATEKAVNKKLQY